MELVKKYKWPILLISLVMVNIGWGLYSNQMNQSRVYLEQKQAAGEAANISKEESGLQADEEPLKEVTEAEVSSPSAEVSKIEPPQKIPVYICGEIKNPGVYYVLEESIINEVIEQSGGFTEEANLLAVNLAATVRANEKIIIPKQGEEIDKLMDSYDNRERTEEQSTSQTDINKEGLKLININTASKEALMTLSGIGEVKASAIIAYRQENGSFNSIDEIRNISGIGEKTFEKIKQFITT